MKTSNISLLILFIVAMFLLFSAANLRRDYQDSWILEGLEIPFMLFVATYALVFFSEKKLSLMVALAVIGRYVFMLIPSLKYVWFQGIWIDQHIQYGLANTVYNGGHIASQNIFGVSVYGSTPFIHLLFAVFSIVPDIPIVDSFKYLPVLLSPIYPLGTYVIMKNSKFLRGTTALKYALFVSSIPISSEKYVVTGAQFGVLLTFLVLTSLVILLRMNDRRHWAIFIFLILALAATHSSSSVLLTAFLFAILLIQKAFYSRLKLHLRVALVFAATLICGAWLVFRATTTFKAIAIRFALQVPLGATSEVGNVPPRFFELARVDMLEAAKVVLVRNGGDVLLLLLTIGGLLIMLKMRKHVDNTSKFLFVIGGLMLMLIPFGFLIKVGGFRALHILSPLFPIFSGIFVLHTCKTRLLMRAIIFSSILLLATLQLYSCQPLVPSANAVSKDLHVDEPIFYVIGVNSIYQRQMIEFSRDYVNGLIACDGVTGNQITGLTEFDFSAAHLARYYPLDKNETERTYDCFLIHVPGISGGFGEQAEIRTRDLVTEAIYNSSIIYTNGESYILTHNPSYQ